MKEMKKILFTGIIMTFIFMLVGCGTKTYNLNDYVDYEISGYDGYGKISYDFDKDKLWSDIQRDLDLDNGIAQQVRNGISECTKLDVSNRNNLSNGDEVVLTFKQKSVDRFNEITDKISFTYIETVIPVVGLNEIEAFDPFDYISVSFAGAAPNGKVIITIDESRPEMEYVTVSANKTDGLSNGDTIEVTVALSGSIESFVNKFNRIINEAGKIYTVSDLASYASEINDIPDNIYKQMDQQLQDNFMAGASSWKNVKTLSIKGVGNYLLTLKNEAESDTNNYLYFVYKVIFSSDYIDDFTYYWFGYYSDVMVSEDGTCTINLDNYEVSKAKSNIFGNSGDYLPVDSKHFVAGFEDIESLYKKHIEPKTDKFECLDYIDDSFVENDEETLGESASGVAVQDGLKQKLTYAIISEVKGNELYYYPCEFVTVNFDETVVPGDMVELSNGSKFVVKDFSQKLKDNFYIKKDYEDKNISFPQYRLVNKNEGDDVLYYLGERVSGNKYMVIRDDGEDTSHYMFEVGDEMMKAEFANSPKIYLYGIDYEDPDMQWDFIYMETVNKQRTYTVSELADLWNNKLSYLPGYDLVFEYGSRIFIQLENGEITEFYQIYDPA